MNSAGIATKEKSTRSISSIYNSHVREFASAATEARPLTSPVNVNVADINRPSWSSVVRELERIPSVGPAIAAVNASAVSSRSGLERTYSLSEGVVLGIKFSHKIYGPTDSFVSDSAIRTAITNNLQGNGLIKKNVCWVETAGVMEPGVGLLGTIPINALAGVGGGLALGFTADTILRYETVYPKIIGMFDEPTVSPVDNFHIPQTAVDANKMIPGSEITVSGQGKLYGDAGVLFRYGAHVGPATAGAGANVVISGSMAKEYSLNIMSLGDGHVRVTLRDLDEVAAGVSARLMAGLLFGAASIPIGGSSLPLKLWGNGQLKDLLERGGFKNLGQFITTFTSVSAGISDKVSKKSFNIASFDFDLNNVYAQKAYERLLLLSPHPAENLSSVAGSGITRVSSHEDAHDNKVSADINFFGEKLFLAEYLHMERTGTIDELKGKRETYNDSSIKIDLSSPLIGSKNIEWEAVSIKDNKGESKPYFRFRFNRSDKHFKERKLDHFLAFSSALYIDSLQGVSNNGKQVAIYKHMFRKSRKVDTNIDIYFTKKGIENIDKADAATAQQAFKEVVADMAQFAPLTAYQHQKLMREAVRFGRAIEKLTNVQNPKQVATFFTTFGKQNAFHYRPTIAALGKLAGNDETLVHKLQMRGGGIVLSCSDEGKLQHPREMVMKLLTRIPE